MKNFLLLSIYLLLGALSVNGQKKSLEPLYPRIPSAQPRPVPRDFIRDRDRDTILTEVVIAAGTTTSLVYDYKNTFSPTINKIATLRGLTSRSSFQRIYRHDFATVSGINDLPVSQIFVSLNSPEIKIGQFLPVYSSNNGIPVLSVYPYVSGKLNKDNELLLTRNVSKDIDPNIGRGLRLIFTPEGLGNTSNYFFDPANPNVQMFVRKNDLIKEKLAKDYVNPDTLQVRIKDLEKSRKKIMHKIEVKKMLQRYIDTTTHIYRDENNRLVIYERGNSNVKEEFDSLWIDQVLRDKWKKQNQVIAVRVFNGQILVNFKSGTDSTLEIADFIPKPKQLEDEIVALREEEIKKATLQLKMEELMEVPTWVETVFKNNKDVYRYFREKQLEKYNEDQIYEAEKEAPYSTKSFFWIMFEPVWYRNRVDLFRKDTIQTNQNFQVTGWALAANYAMFTKNITFGFFIKYEENTTNLFFRNQPETFVYNKPLPKSSYLKPTSTSAYDVNGLTNSEFNKKVSTGIWSLGATFLYGNAKKYGITTNYRRTNHDEIANLKIGAILPAILDKAKAEQTNIIIEMVIPDWHTKDKTNIEKQVSEGLTPWKRKFFNLKVGIPINLL